jgi:Na+-transporting NADH:ubiquinone oxidoreductase subunit A
VRAEPSGLLPLEVLDRAFPLRLPLAPLLRALLAGDVDSALAFGALELEEEDLALASFLDPTRNDYARLLRAVLSQLAERMP